VTQPSCACAMVTREHGHLGEVELHLCGPGSLSERLESEGYCIVDDAASPQWCAALEAELRDLHTVHSLLQPSLNRVATSRAGSGAAAGAGLGESLAPPPTGVVCCKTGITELDIVYAGQLVRSDALDLSPTLHAWWYGDGSRKLLAQINAAAPWLRLTHVDTIKAQYNVGIGGCFPMHFDTTPETSARTLTAILYLSQNWEADHGGSLRVIPFPLANVDIPPLGARLGAVSAVSMPRIRSDTLSSPLW
jgi:2OG-Fe(II) oxygenase superfamily